VILIRQGVLQYCDWHDGRNQTHPLRRLIPHETLITVDSMTGGWCANTAKAFNESLPQRVIWLNWRWCPGPAEVVQLYIYSSLPGNPLHLGVVKRPLCPIPWGGGGKKIFIRIVLFQAYFWVWGRAFPRSEERNAKIDDGFSWKTGQTKRPKVLIWRFFPAIIAAKMSKMGAIMVHWWYNCWKMGRSRCP